MDQPHAKLGQRLKEKKKVVKSSVSKIVKWYAKWKDIKYDAKT